MNLEFYKTKHKGLKKYIEGYYFISENKNSDLLHYWTFPNNFFIISVNENADVSIENNRIIVKHSSDKNIVADYVASYIKPIEVCYINPVNEITFYFKPLGIHHFIENAQSLLMTKAATDFMPFPDFIDKMAEIFLLNDRNEQIEQLEEYWLSKLIPQPLSLLESVLVDIESDQKIDDVARKHNLSRQYLHKLFKNNVGKSPSEYRKIHRFRSAISKQHESKTLTQLTYDQSYYDQSHFIKDFRTFANINPHLFFDKVDTRKDNIWLFI
ncbi:helix-turn-helix domain-containing protein [Mucilaginibacter sp. RS28]|uniref:Helix-turn-helix domain-containing protein n=1 Tax=Mucilaginibacter straminoryzae TaxID=2932774 RepID=A0A9X2BCA7_9SPHI|nr:helix-turn-helix domain-containing protein [Mucilaginibacter straminoryzae]MCJ8209103.1 helix-turn-helix domain-containing protein [Mucilaginibacter straminoryzae]